MNISFFSLSLFLGSIAFAGEQKLIATSGFSKVQLIELYTSESCSSCPPAEQWLSELKNSAGLWKHFVPVAFHVDYWNQLGWKDDFSSSEMTQRQVQLARSWGNSSGVYTPGMVLAGKEWQDWRHVIDHQIPGSAGNTAFSISLYQENDDGITVKVSGLKNDHAFTLRAAKLGMDLSSNVTGGENSGKLLRHDFVVLDWASKTVNSKITEQTFHFKDLRKKASRFAIAVWIEEEGNPTPLQAVGAYL